MADVQRLESDGQRREKANEWLARLDMEDCTSEDRARFEVWRRAHPRNARAYDEVSKTWNHLRSMGTVVQAYDMGQTLSESTQRAIRRARAVRVRGTRVAFATAAAIAVAIFSGWWTSTRSPETQFQTAVGEHATVKLPDGSSLELNSNSLAKVVYSPQARIIHLERGEAFFQVEHDPQRPFWVSAGQSWVGAVGTAFNVDLRAAEMRVTVSEGTVKVAAIATRAAPPNSALGDDPVSLIKAGQQVSVRGAASEVRSLAPMQMSRSMSWRLGSLDFKNDRLADVVEELNRYSMEKIVVDDKELMELQIGGIFETNSHGAESLLSTVEDGFGLKVRRDGRTVHISQR